MKKIKLQIESYNQKGDGIGFHENKPYFVRGGIAGEIVEIEVIEEYEKWGKGTILKILEESKNRRHNLPDNHLIIGGYEILHMLYPEQIRFKNQKIKNDFKQNAKFDLIQEQPVLSKEFRYRNKITLHNGGFHIRETNDVIMLDDFLLTDISPESDLEGKTIIRKLDTLISGNDKSLETTDNMLGLKFFVPLKAFYQVNKEIAIKAYKEMISFIEKGDVVFDLYSGIGTLTLIASKIAKEVYGVEWNKHSHNAAIKNMNINKINNVNFIKSDVNDFLSKTKIKPDVIIVDPAREGLKRETCEKILKLKPQRIIYLSCNPATQAADFNRLKDEYNIKLSKFYDMFPQTYHAENLIVLDKK